MSVQNLLSPNNLAIYANTIRSTTIFATGFSATNLSANDLAVNVISSNAPAAPVALNGNLAITGTLDVTLNTNLAALLNVVGATTIGTDAIPSNLRVLGRTTTGTILPINNSCNIGEAGDPFEAIFVNDITFSGANQVALNKYSSSGPHNCDISGAVVDPLVNGFSYRAVNCGDFVTMSFGIAPVVNDTPGPITTTPILAQFRPASTHSFTTIINIANVPTLVRIMIQSSGVINIYHDIAAGNFPGTPGFGNTIDVGIPAGYGTNTITYPII